MFRLYILLFIFIFNNTLLAGTTRDEIEADNPRPAKRQNTSSSNGSFEMVNIKSNESFDMVSPTVSSSPKMLSPPHSPETSSPNHVAFNTSNSQKTESNSSSSPVISPIASPIHLPVNITTNNGAIIRTNGVYIEETEEEPLASTRNRPRVHRPIGIVNPNNHLPNAIEQGAINRTLESLSTMPTGNFVFRNNIAHRPPPAPDQDPVVLARIELGNLMTAFFNHNPNPANGGQNEVNNEYSNSQTNEHISERTLDALNPTPRINNNVNDEYFQLTTFPAFRTTSNGSPASTLEDNVRNDTEQTNRDNELLQSTVINNAIENINNNLTDDQKMEVEVYHSSPINIPTSNAPQIIETEPSTDFFDNYNRGITQSLSTTNIVYTNKVDSAQQTDNNEVIIEAQPKIAQPIVEENIVIDDLSNRPMIKDETITLPATTNDVQTRANNNSSPIIPEVIVQQQVLPTFSSVDNNIRQMKNKFPELVSELFNSSMFDLDGYYTLGIFSSYKYKDFKANTYGSLISAGKKYDKYAYSIGIGLIRSDLRYHELKRSADTSIMSTRLQYFIDDNNTLNLVPSIAITRFNKKYMYNYNIKTYIDSKLNFKNFNLDLILGADAKFLAYHKDNADAMTKIRLYNEYTRGNLKFEPSITFGIYSPRNILYLNHRLKFDINDSFCAIDFELFSKKKNYHFIVSSKLAIWF